MMPFPPNPIAAVTHPDPYPYYAALVAERPVYRDDALGLWVASSADAVTAALTHECCRVRPPAEPVPAALLGSSAGDVFRHLVRTTDGASHCPLKRAVSATLDSIEEARAAELSAEWARRLAGELELGARSHGLREYAFRLPVYVVGSLLGVPRERLHQAALRVEDFVRCLAPASSPEQVARGKDAVADLLDTFRDLLATGGTGPADGLLGTLAREARRHGRDGTDTIAANGIGLMTQSYEATAGLLGNSLVALATHRDARELVDADPARLVGVVREVLRHDPPVQNTRRFLARDAVVAGHRMREGDAILIVLAAANRDPSANADPDRFDPARESPRSFTFGAGPHGCPGERLAVTIARVGVAHLLAAGLVPERVREPVAYRPSANARIPLLDGGVG